MLESALGHELHADADAEEGAATSDALLDRLAHAVHGRQAPRAIGKRALSGQHDAIGPRHPVRVGGHRHLGVQPQAFGGERQTA